MIQSLLDTAETPSGGSGMSNIIMLVILAVLIVVVVVFYVLGSKKRKKQEKDAQDLINAVKPGNKVKTIGGICGIVVEVDNDENTFVLETGTEVSGKSYIKFDRQAIYQTDAVVETAKETVEEKENSEDKLTTVSEEIKEAEPVTGEPVVAPAVETAEPLENIGADSASETSEAAKPAPKKRAKTTKKPESEEN